MLVDPKPLARAHDVAQVWFAKLSTALERQDSAAVGDLFWRDGYWRDILAFTHDLRTFSGNAAITAELAAVLGRAKPTALMLEQQSLRTYERRGFGCVIELLFTFETKLGPCRGHVRLLARVKDETELADPENWRAWTFFTVLQDLRGYEEPAGTRRRIGDHTVQLEQPDAVAAHDEPQVLIVGAGHSGLSLAARLTQLDVSVVVVDRNERIGDNWRNRYSSLVLHNQVWANHMPYLPFPTNWPVYLDKDEMADWLEHYAALMHLDVRTATGVRSGSYSEVDHRWTIDLIDPGGQTRVMRPRHVVLATGIFGPPRRPEIAGLADYTGVVTHSTEYADAAEVTGESILIIGSGSSAHDIAQDLHGRGADVTMLQRSSTCVLSLHPGAARAYAVYREHGPNADDCDMIMNSYPLELLAKVHQGLTEQIAEMDSELLQGLRDVNFALDFGQDGSGYLLKYLRSGGGYYINVGCSDLIISGAIQIKQGVEVEKLDGKSVHFTDGSAMVADRVIMATGFNNMSVTVQNLFGDEVAERVGPIWGLDEQGELRGMWRHTGQPGLWVMGGSLQQCRPYSKYLALQIKADEEGLWN